jgi:hypothetical protein
LLIEGIGKIYKGEFSFPFINPHTIIYSADFYNIVQISLLISAISTFVDSLDGTNVPAQCGKSGESFVMVYGNQKQLFTLPLT